MALCTFTASTTFIHAQSTLQNNNISTYSSYKCPNCPASMYDHTDYGSWRYSGTTSCTHAKPTEDYVYKRSVTTYVECSYCGWSSSPVTKTETRYDCKW